MIEILSKIRIVGMTHGNRTNRAGRKIKKNGRLIHDLIILKHLWMMLATSCTKQLC